MAPLWFRRLLALCPAAIVLLWLVGLTHFRAITLQPIEWFVLVAATFALLAIGRRLARPRPLPPLPPQANPTVVALMAAAFVAVPAMLVALLVEWLADRQQPAATSLLLRGAWHGACVFAIGYCSFLGRLLAQRRSPPPAPPIAGA